MIITAFSFISFRLLTVKKTYSKMGKIYYFVTVQYLHSYDAKSIPNRLHRWDFALTESFSYGLSSKCFDLY